MDLDQAVFIRDVTIDPIPLLLLKQHADTFLADLLALAGALLLNGALIRTHFYLAWSTNSFVRLFAKWFDQIMLFSAVRYTARFSEKVTRYVSVTNQTHPCQVCLLFIQDQKREHFKLLT